ncbi:MAG: hypothetical protein PUK18_12355 [Firmicutes bacterium]|nr:hypothetical protein [Bacillota bacterium]MDY6160475.1 hypothetical protein [Candidatus Faecousia sp.]
MEVRPLVPGTAEGKGIDGFWKDGEYRLPQRFLAASGGRSGEDQCEE